MKQSEKLKYRVLKGNSDRNIDFKSLCNLLVTLGFDKRLKGDHHIFTRSDIPEIINLQPIGTKAKSYQVKQVRNLIIKYHLGGDDE